MRCLCSPEEVLIGSQEASMVFPESVSRCNMRQLPRELEHLLRLPDKANSLQRKTVTLLFTFIFTKFTSGCCKLANF